MTFAKWYKTLFGVERVGLAWWVLTTVLLFVFWGRMEQPADILLGRIGVLAGTLVLWAVGQRWQNRATDFLRVAGQLALLAYWYPDTYEFNRLFPNLDHLFAGFEQQVFGCQPSLEMSRFLSSGVWSEAFNLGYWAYYPMIFGTVLYYFIRRTRREFLWAARVVLAAFCCYYLVYMFLPVAGPQYYFQAIGVDQAAAGFFPSVGDYFNYHTEMLPAPGDENGLFYRLVGQSQAAGERPTAAFPSSHVGMSTILMLLAARVSRKLTLTLTPFYILLCGATVYIQAHYAIDVMAGWVTAVLVYGVVKRNVQEKQMIWQKM